MSQNLKHFKNKYKNSSTQTGIKSLWCPWTVEKKSSKTHLLPEGHSADIYPEVHGDSWNINFVVVKLYSQEALCIAMCSLLILIYFLLTVVHSYSCRFCHLLCRESDPPHPQQQIVRSLRTLRSQRYWQSPCLLWYWRYLRHYSYWYCPSWHYSVCGLRTTETTCLHVWNKIHKH